MSFTGILATAVWWAAVLALLLMFVAIMLSMITSRIRWRLMLSSGEGSSPELVRTGFLFGNLGLAAGFLLTILDSGGEAAALREATDMLGVLDISALTGTASAAYVWSKLAGRGA